MFVSISNSFSLTCMLCSFSAVLFLCCIDATTTMHSKTRVCRMTGGVEREKRMGNWKTKHLKITLLFRSACDVKIWSKTTNRWKQTNKKAKNEKKKTRRKRADENWAKNKARMFKLIEFWNGAIEIGKLLWLYVEVRMKWVELYCAFSIPRTHSELAHHLPEVFMLKYAFVMIFVLVY